MSIKVYWRSEPPCPFCEKAKSLLYSKQIDFEAIDLGVDISIDYFKMMNPQVKTVPAIFIDEVYVGGYEQLKKKIDDGELL